MYSAIKIFPIIVKIKIDVFMILFLQISFSSINEKVAIIEE